MWIHRDITERELLDIERHEMLEREREMRLGMEEQNRSLRELDELKNEFVATVSHELRTPLTSIVSFAELLNDGSEGLSEEQREFLAIVDRNAHRLLDIVGDLLLVAKLESGGLGIERQPTGLPNLIDHALESFGAEVATKNVSLSTEYAESRAPAMIDPVRMDQAIANLVSNAVKFTPAGGTVSVGTRRVDGAWSITVSDTGIGIPSGEVDRLFQRFYRGSNARLQELPGTGLGLAIVRAIVDLHGGNLDVVSDENVGTTITVTIPDELPNRHGRAPEDLGNRS